MEHGCYVVLSLWSASFVGVVAKASASRAVVVACWLIGCLTSQRQASVSRGRICSDNRTCCITETEVVNQTFYFTQP